MGFVVPITLEPEGAVGGVGFALCLNALDKTLGRVHLPFLGDRSGRSEGHCNTGAPSQVEKINRYERCHHLEIYTASTHPKRKRRPCGARRCRRGRRRYFPRSYPDAALVRGGRDIRGEPGCE